MATPESMLAKVVLECGDDISASQEEILAVSSFLGGDKALPTSDESEEEVFATPPDATQQHQDDPVTVCTLPITPTPTPSKSKSPAPPSGDPRRKPRVCIRKARGARISTPTPSPDQQQLDRQPEQEQLPVQQPQPEQPTDVDPLVGAVLMIPTKATTTTTRTTTSRYPEQEFLALARRKGLI